VNTGTSTRGSAFQVQAGYAWSGTAGACTCAGVATIDKAIEREQNSHFAAHRHVEKNRIGRVSQIVTIKAIPDRRKPA
jgi:hypothetical protein